MKFSKASRLESKAIQISEDVVRLKKLINQSHLLEEVLNNKESKPSKIKIYMEGDGLRNLAISTSMEFKLEEIWEPLQSLMQQIDNEIGIITVKYHPIFLPSK